MLEITETTEATTPVAPDNTQTGENHNCAGGEQYWDSWAGQCRNGTVPDANNPPTGPYDLDGDGTVTPGEGLGEGESAEELCAAYGGRWCDLGGG